jgi:hypothetical protein
MYAVYLHPNHGPRRLVAQGRTAHQATKAAWLEMCWAGGPLATPSFEELADAVSTVYEGEACLTMERQPATTKKHALAGNATAP